MADEKESFVTYLSSKEENRIIADYVTNYYDIENVGEIKYLDNAIIVGIRNR